MEGTNTPNLPTGQLWTMAKNDVTWLMKHERIVIVALVLTAGIFLGNKWLNYDSAQKDAKVVALTALVEQDKTNVANIAQQAAQAQAAFQTTMTALTAQNAALAQANAQQSALLSKNKAIDKALPLPELGKRIEALAPGSEGGITATTNGLSMDETASRSVAIALEEVPVLTLQLKDETQIAQNNGTLLNQSQVVNADLTKQVGALNVQIGDQTKQCKAEVDSVKAEARKSKRNWFIGGIAAGVSFAFKYGKYF